VAFGVAVLPARAFAAGGQPEKLTDAQLDDVVGGDRGGPPAFVLAGGHGHGWERNHGSQGVTNIGTQVIFTIQDVNFIFNVGSNSDVNLAAALQLSLLSQQPQAASATAVQSAAHH
jgi:hypothetical protein